MCVFFFLHFFSFSISLNILESIKLVQKLRKDIYVWSGFHRVGETLLAIKQHADNFGIFEPIPVPPSADKSGGGKSKSLAVLAHQVTFSWYFYFFFEPSFFLTPDVNNDDFDIICFYLLFFLFCVCVHVSQFISMFVTDACQKKHVTLDEAAACLAKKDASPAEVKTKARRLYDIVSVFLKALFLLLSKSGQ